MNNAPAPMTRRQALCHAGTGLGMLGLVGLLQDAGLLGQATAAGGTRGGGHAGNRRIHSRPGPRSSGPRPST